MRWEDGSLVIDIDEVTVPIPSRLKGTVRLTPSAICGHEVGLDAEGLHVWRPVAPFSAIEARFEKPGLSWSGIGYHDSNWGAVPLEDSFESWVWSRAAKKDGAAIIYDTVLRDGATSAFAIEIGADGSLREGTVPARRGMSTTFWRMKRHMRADAGFPRGVAAGGFALLCADTAPCTDGRGGGGCVSREPVAGEVQEPGGAGDAAVPDAAAGVRGKEKDARVKPGHDEQRLAQQPLAASPPSAPHPPGSARPLASRDIFFAVLARMSLHLVIVMLGDEGRRLECRNTRQITSSSVWASASCFSRSFRSSEPVRAISSSE
jgi:hypothetical protein